MVEGVDLGWRHLTPDDIRALVVYLRSVPPVTGDDPPRVVTPADPSYRVGRAESGDRTGEKIFAGSCMGCHGWTGVSPVSRRSEEHTSELQSLMRISYAVFCLKKKNKKQIEARRDMRQHN